MNLNYIQLITWCCIAVAVLVIGCALLFLIALRLYVYLSMGIYKSENKMNGKTVIVTGCTSGIGKETARNLYKRGARVIMACRNVESANKVKDELMKEASQSPGLLVVRKLDLSSLKSVREFAQKVNQEERALHVLIHNAGTAETFRKKVTEDGLEMTMGTNYYGPFLLTHLLIDLMKKSAPSRIVVVASELYRLASLNFNNLNPTNTFPAYLYYVSKYANIVFTLELARRLEGSGVTANCLHPGMIDSGIWRNVPIPLSWGLKLVMKAYFKTPKEGAQTSIYLAVANEVKNENGKYFLDCHESTLSSGVQDMAKGKKLWEISESLVKLTPTDRTI